MNSLACPTACLVLVDFFFTKIMKVALTYLRDQKNITISSFLDHHILLNYRHVKNALEGAYAAGVFQNLGFTINISKSVIVSTKIIEHLGFIINSATMISMTLKKTSNLVKLIRHCLANESSTIRQIASVIGKIAATEPINVLLYSLSR